MSSTSFDDFDFVPDEFAGLEYSFDAAAASAPSPAAPLRIAAPRPSSTGGLVGTASPSARSSKATAAAQTQAPSAPISMYGRVPDPALVPEAAAMARTDMGLGERLVLHYRDRLAFRDDGNGLTGYTWTGTHWAEDRDGVAAEANCRTVIASISNEEAQHAASTDPGVAAAQSAYDMAEALGMDTKKLETELQRATQLAMAECITFGERCENGTIHITSAVKAARPALTVPGSKFDAEPYLVNFRNGTLDVRTLTLTPHDPRQYLTKVTAVDWKPAASHPDLDRVLGTLAKSDPGLPAFLQRYLGASVTGLNSAKAFLYVKGPADAGKSTLFEALAHALGDLNGSGYARIVSPSLFALSSSTDGERPQPKLHALMGTRLIFCDEAEAGFMDRVTVNTMSAGGTMQTRRLHGAPVSWRSQAKIVFAGNEYMALPDNDPGIRRRLIASELTHRLAGAEIDVNLQDRIRSTTALEAILAWAVQGAHEWVRAGADREALLTTAKTAADTARYLGEADPLAEWWADCVIEVDEDNLDAEVDEGRTGADHVPLTTSDFHERYTQYCRRHSIPVLNLKRFAERLTARGFKAMKNSDTYRRGGTVLNKGKFRQGIRHRGDTNTVLFDRSDF